MFWIGASSGKLTRQWLVQLSRGVTTPEEQKAHRAKEITKYLSWGPVVVFKSDVDALDLWIAGPVDIAVHSGGLYRVECDAGHEVLAQLSGRMRRCRIKVVPGDRVTVGVSPYDPVRGIITFRAR